MSRYATVCVDRRRQYYERATDAIAHDPLDFYCRAEKGRRWQRETFQAASDYEREAIGTARPVEPWYES